MNKKTLNTLLAGAVATVAVAGVSSSAHAIKDGQEKCYGVVKAGKNGCGSADKAHGCAGQASVDGSGVEWVALPKGTCEKIVGGSVEPVMDDMKKDMKH
ncbi:MAG: BufA1 family periplasmic bufferin-type metallophore [Alphaproteobacteria bacterium]